MESMDYWRLCDALSIFQAALLIVGEDPSKEATYAEMWDEEKRPLGYTAAKTALVNAVKTGDIKPVQYTSDLFPDSVGDFYTDTRNPNIKETILPVSDVKKFLASKGITSGFFFPDGAPTDKFLDASHPCYAPKLAAAINAWLAVSGDESLLNGKTPKQAMERWLRLNANQFGLTKEDGSPNEQGIEEVSKIANWNTKGGAPKTPTGVKG